MRDHRTEAVVAGAWGGVVGAVVVDVLAVVVAHLLGYGIWQALKCPPFPFAMHRGYNLPVIVAGQVSHLIVAVSWGLLFGVLFGGGPRWLKPLVGLFYGVAVWGAMFLPGAAGL